jgi:hypothetical protein
MLTSHTRFLRGEISATALFLAVSVGLAILMIAPRTEACWNLIERQCFSTTTGVDSVNMPWCWTHPAGTGRRWCRMPNPPQITWGIQNIVFDDHLCTGDDRALWCTGSPANRDPNFDDYPSNYSGYVRYGPIDLSTATAAQVSFWLYDNSEADHDSIFWGAAVDSLLPRPPDQNRLRLNIGGAYSGSMTGAGFTPEFMDLAQLVNNETGRDTSLLGNQRVWVFWYFRSDPNGTVDVGAFVDNVQINVEDGGLDVIASAITLTRLDSAPFVHPVEDDSALANFRWMTCSSIEGTYPAFRIMGLLDATVILDTVITGAVAGMDTSLWTRPWRFTAGAHNLRFVVDTLNQVGETDETNNVTTLDLAIPRIDHPPTVVWLRPGAEGPAYVYPDSGLWLKWIAYDDDAISTVTVYYDLDSQGCNGIAIPGSSRTVPPSATPTPPDSFFWNLHGRPNGAVLWPYLQATDTSNTTCVIAPHPVMISSADDPFPNGLTPERYFLEQNFPNPFNPTTEFVYGIHQGGPVRLAVFDLLGREVATVVSGDRVPGVYHVVFDGSKLPSGVYLFSLHTPEGTQARKMMLMK